MTRKFTTINEFLIFNFSFSISRFVPIAVILIWLFTPISQLNAQDWQEIIKALPEVANTNKYDRMGYSIAVRSRWALVGAPFDSENGFEAGAAYFMAFTDGEWVVERKYMPSDGQPGDFFGRSVGINGSDYYIGAPGVSGGGAVYMFESNTTTPRIKYTPSTISSGDEFGEALSVNGDRIMVGAPGHDSDAGKVYGLLRSGTSSNQTLSLQVTFIPTGQVQAGSRFGDAIAYNRNTLVVGAPEYEVNGNRNVGRVFVWTGSGSSWTMNAVSLQGENTRDGFFGISVDTYFDSRIIIGEPGGNSGQGKAYVLHDSEEGNGALIWRWTMSRGFSDVLSASDGGNGDFFGGAVSLSNASGGIQYYITSKREDEAAPNGGSIYVFQETSTTLGNYQFAERAKLTVSDAMTSDEMGFAIAVDESRFVVTAPFVDTNGKSSGAFYSFSGNASNWTEEAKGLPTPYALTFGEEFGHSIDVDGDVAVIGAPNDSEVLGNGSATVLLRDPVLGWQSVASLTASDGAEDDAFGFSVSIDGDWIAVGANEDDDEGTGSGAAYLFQKPISGWSDMTETQKLVGSTLTSSDDFGAAIAIEGTMLAVGAPSGNSPSLSSSGVAYLFEYNGSSWQEVAILSQSDPASGDRFSSSIAISEDQVVVGAPLDDDLGSSSGSAYVFEKPVSGWTTMNETAKLTASNGRAADDFGFSATIQGDVVLVGAPDAPGGASLSGSLGAVYGFSRPESGWQTATESFILHSVSDHDDFGYSVAYRDSVVAVGAPNADASVLSNVGAIEIFHEPASGWATTSGGEVFFSSNPVADSYFGRAVATSGDYVIGGASSENTLTGSVNIFEDRRNKAPSFVLGEHPSANQDAGAVSLSAFVSDIADGDDHIAQNLTFTVTNDNNDLFAVQPAISPSGDLTFTTSGASGLSGQATVTVSLSDDAGTAFNGTDTSEEQTFVITVLPRFQELLGNNFKAFVQGSKFTVIDYDQDNDLDYFVSGFTFSAPNTNGAHFDVIYENTDGVFNETILTSLTEFNFTQTISWSDFDLDGDLDLFRAGISTSDKRVGELYVNTNGSFIKSDDQPFNGIDGVLFSGWGDYDNDGDDDLVVSGNPGGRNAFTFLFQNMGDGSFTKVSEDSFIANETGFVKWADVDADGDLDLCLLGALYYFYRNNGDGSFTRDFGANFISGLLRDFTDFVDFDNDGDLDIAGLTINSSVPENGIFSNIDGEFVQQTGSEILDISRAQIAYGDWDADGYYDIVLGGEGLDTENDPISFNSKIYRNNRDNTLTELYSDNLVPMGMEELQMADFDLDGDLDIIAVGTYNVEEFSRDGKFAIFDNTGTQVNTPPSAPTSLQVDKSIPGELTFAWTAATDNETPSVGLSYDLIIVEGTLSNPSRFVRHVPIDLSTGFRQLANKGTLHTTSWTLHDILPEGSYEWAVQAVDAGFAGSPFATGAFTLEGGTDITAFSFAEQTQAAVIDEENFTIHAEVSSEADLMALTAIFTLSDAAIVTIGEVTQESGETSNDFSSLTGLVYTVIAENGLIQDWQVYVTKPQFESAFTGSVDVTQGGFSWADFDGDDDLDVMFTGLDNAAIESFAGFFVNDANTVFGGTSPTTGLGSDGGFSRNDGPLWADYDNDGDLDVMLIGYQGVSSSEPAVVLLENNDGNFTAVETGISPLVLPAGAWADYDLDGDLDFIISGSTTLSNAGAVTILYENQGENGFVEVADTPFADVYYGSVSWGDYDNDGDEDLFITGNNRGTSVAFTAALYNNDEGLFTEVEAGTFVGVFDSYSAFIDFDNDGDLDISYAGGALFPDRHTKLYQNNGLAGFAEVFDDQLTDVDRSKFEWGDYNNDGFADLMLYGRTFDPTTTIGELYINQEGAGFRKEFFTEVMGGEGLAWGDVDGDNDLDLILRNSFNFFPELLRNLETDVNSAPAAPTNFQVDTNTSGEIAISWEASVDDHTGSAGLSYDYYIKADGEYLVAVPANIASGYRRLAVRGNIQTTTYLINIDLQPEVFYEIGVQAVDQSFVGSPFVSYSFTFGPPEVEIVIADTELSIGESTDVSFIFSEEVSGFDLDDTESADGSLSELTTSDNITYSAIFIPNENYENDASVIELDLTGVLDTESNLGNNTTSSEFFAVDTKAPSVIITSDDLALAKDETTTFTFTFSEAVIAFTKEDVLAENGVLSDVVSVDDGITFTATFTPTELTEDLENVLIVDNTAYTDLAGNVGIGTSVSENYTIDGVIPTVSISMSDDGLKAGETSDVTFTFSEIVIGFDNADITAEQGTLTDVASEDGGLTFTAIFTPTPDFESEEDFFITVDNTGYLDERGNTGAGTTSGPSYDLETLRPTVVITMDDTSLIAGEIAIVTFAFSESVGSPSEAISAENGIIDADPSSDDGLTYTAAFVPSDDFESLENLVSVDMSILTDQAGNAGLGVTSLSYSIDTKEPTLIITIDDLYLLEGESTLVTFEFSEEVSAFTIDDIGTVNGSISELISTDNIQFTAIFTPDEELAEVGNVITVSGANYTDLVGNPGTEVSESEAFEINTVIPVITFEPLATKTYGDADFALIANVTSEDEIVFSSSNPQVASVENNMVTILAAGSTVISASQPADENTNAAITVEQTLTIDQAILTVIAADKSKIYGESNPALTFTYEGFVNDEDESVIIEDATATTTADETSSVGNYVIEVAEASAANYDFIYVPGELTINQKELVASADDKAKVYGEENPELTIVYSGFENGDAVTDITEPIIATTATVASGVGVYPITLSDGSAINYSIQLVDAELTVTPANLTISADNKLRAFGEENPLLTITYEGFVLNETEADLDIAPAISTEAVVTSDVGTYPITIGGAQDVNYEINYAQGTLTIEKANQTIDFATVEEIDLLNENQITLVASASSNLNVVFELILGEGSIEGNVLTANASGTFTVVAAQAGNGNYNATSLSQTFNVNDSRKENQTISFGELEDKSYGDLPFTLIGSTTSGLDLTYSSTGPISLDGGEVTILGAGDVTITAIQNGDDTFNPAPPVSQTFAVAKAALTVSANDQITTFDAPVPELTISYTGFVGLDSSSDLDVLPTTSTEAVTGSDAGTYEITVSGGSDANYNFVYASGQLKIEKANQSIDFATIEEIDLLNSNTITLEANASTGLDVEFQLVSGDGNVTGNLFTANASGTFVVTATQSGNGNYNPITVAQTFNVKDSRKSEQTITFGGLANKIYGDVPFSISASASSDLDVTFTAEGPVTLVGTEITILGAGEVTINATQPGDDTFNPAPSVSQMFVIAKAPLTVSADDQTATFGASISDLTISYTGFVGLDSSSDLDELPTTSTEAISGSDVGTYVITVTGGNDDNYDFTYVSGQLTIEKADQAITFPAIGDVDIATQTTVNLTATASSELSVAFNLIAGNGSIAGSILTVNNTGTFTVEASQVGNNNYNAASTSQTFIVNDSRKTDQTITFESIENKVYGEVFTIGAQSSSGLSVSYSVVSGSATLSGDELSITGIGTVTILATQAGDDTFNPAADVSQTFEVTKASLMATADNKTITFGDDIPVLTITYQGFIAGESAASLDEEPVASTNATLTSDAGDYVITLAGGTSSNYEITLEDGSLTISKAQAVISITDLEFDVDGSAKMPTITTAPSDLNFTVTYDGLPAAPSAAGSYEVVVTIDEINYAGSATATLVLSDVLSTVSSFNISTYPNPTTQYFRVDASMDLQFEVYSMSGVLELISATNQQTDVSSLSEGVYLIRILAPNGNVLKTQQLIKQ